MKNLTLRNFLILWLACGSTLVQAGYLINPWENHLQPYQRLRFGIEASSLSTSANYSASGIAFTPTGFEKLGRLGVDVNAAFGLGDRFTPYGRISWAYVKTEGTTRPGTAFGFADQVFGGAFRLTRSETFTLDAQVQGEFPAYSNQQADNNLHPYIGDGSVDFTFGGFAGLALIRHETETLLFEGGAGYHLRGSGFSAAIPWSAQIRYERNRAGLIGQAGLMGYHSLSNDEKKNLIVGDQDVSLNTGSSRSYYTNAVNPSLLQISGKVGYQTENQLQIYGGIQTPLSGKSSAKATTFLVGIVLHDDRGERNASSDVVADLRGMNDPEEIQEIREDGEGQVPAKEELSRANKGFITYSMDAKVVRVNDKLHLVKIDKGRDSQIQTGQRFDLFSVDAEGTAAKAIARARVTSVRANEAALEITEYFEENVIDEGFIAKRIGPARK